MCSLFSRFLSLNVANSAFGLYRILLFEVISLLSRCVVQCLLIKYLGDPLVANSLCFSF